MLPNARQNQILQWIHEFGNLTIEDLAEQLGVSVMTVHRDLDRLVRDGLVVKVHGGVTLPDQQVSKAANPICRVCDTTIQGRTSFTIQLQQGDPVTACCPHCGFLLLSQVESRGVVAALTKDFLYGRVVNAAQAFYVLDSEVSVCCVPSTLCFATRDEASRFQKGFGGTVMTCTDTRAYLIAHHSDIRYHP